MYKLPTLVACRFTSLVRLTIDGRRKASDKLWSFRVTFTGSGIGAHAQALSLRQQLAAFQDSPTTTFLAPSSWPHHACLTRFMRNEHLYDLNPYTSHTQHALQTPSLQDLSLHSPTPALTGALLSKLTNLTHLGFSTHTPTSRNPLLTSLPSLPFLQRLHITIEPSPQGIYNNTVIDAEHTSVTLPPSWRQLSALTALSLYGPPAVSFQLHQLSALPALRNLRIRMPSTGSLADLTHLSRLTRLHIQQPLVEAGPPCGSLALLPVTSGGRAGGSAEGSYCAGEASRAPVHQGTGIEAIPAAWSSKLQHLALSGPWPPLATVLPKLTALRQLSLTSFPITPKLCWWVTPLILPRCSSSPCLS